MLRRRSHLMNMVSADFTIESTSSLRARAYPDDVKMDSKSVSKEARMVPEYRWSIDICIPVTGKCFTVRTQWTDRRTVIDNGRFVSIARKSLLRFFRTGDGLTKDRDGGFTL